MNKLKLNIVIVLLGLGLFSTATLAIYHVEQEKKNQKIELLKTQYKKQYDDLESYKKSYDEQIQKIKDENIKSMQDSKAQYDKLLLQQPAIIKQHTSVVEDTITQPTSTSVAVVKPSTTTTTKTVKVTKPKSTPVTSAS